MKTPRALPALFALLLAVGACGGDPGDDRNQLRVTAPDHGVADLPYCAADGVEVSGNLLAISFAAVRVGADGRTDEDDAVACAPCEDRDDPARAAVRGCVSRRSRVYCATDADAADACPFRCQHNRLPAPGWLCWPRF